MIKVPAKQMYSQKTFGKNYITITSKESIKIVIMGGKSEFVWNSLRLLYRFCCGWRWLNYLQWQRWECHRIFRVKGLCSHLKALWEPWICALSGDLTQAEKTLSTSLFSAQTVSKSLSLFHHLSLNFSVIIKKTSYWPILFVWPESLLHHDSRISL